jgi:salicylate hydroxylase
MAQEGMGTASVIIAGGGIAGLAAALALAPSPVTILERAATFGEVGAALQLGPNAIRALQKLGVWEAVRPWASSPPEIHIWDGLTGRRLMRMALGSAFEKRFGAPYCVMMRADLQSALLSAVRGHRSIALHTASEVLEARSASQGIEAVLAAGAAICGTQLLACDGVNSALRQQAFPGSAAVESGYTLHRATLGHWRQSAGVAWECINLWLCRHAHVVHYPAGQAGRLNLVATTAKDRTPADVHTGSTPMLRDLLGTVQAWQPWPGLYAPALPGWRRGRMLLLGDAAHGTLPFMAQGAAMALEDAACLKDSMQSGGIESANWDGRRRRAARLHAETMRTVGHYHLRGPAAVLRNIVLRAAPAAFILSRQAWLYSG